ncbi:hypothetical protein A2223_01030 [Candidatus Falkowbacteria bacterium RIFOXYA2_FULL_35_8]|uniref:Uncharacterized protein n=1 Tax=Candidatus Falkowbacteria bacterium RIFOXYC2_FULL_36_12 TaxID=1798002 RepID=A0A1F5T3G8_9BACT|nr:MAG: hypothetical protein A2478_02315 [Candidatus Falkowbacteria bacterium RIFOXYC2_FULL_36_12]OGF33548.1 MAG: hypothetical protein A2223_01030 [Candidatus Falkowbacteria bacterium RIFOXYA2_FULL_35_8]
MTLLTWLLAPLVSLFIAPAIMLIVGNKLKVVSNNLNYKHLLLLTFIGLLLGSVFKNLFPFSTTIATIICLLWPIKKQLNTTWMQAVVITISGLLVIITFGYLSTLLLFEKF